MGKITGNDKDFPTIKQVNDALSGGIGGGTLDISDYFKNLIDLPFSEKNEDGTINFQSLGDTKIIELCNTIKTNKPTILIGTNNYQTSTNSPVQVYTNNIDIITSYYTNTFGTGIKFSLGYVLGGFVTFYFVKVMANTWHYIKLTKTLMDI